MKKALVVLLAAAVVCAAAFSRLAFSRTPTLKDTIRLEAEDVEMIYFFGFGPKSWFTRDREYIQAIMNYLYDFPIYGKIGLTYDPRSPDLPPKGSKGPKCLHLITTDGDYGFDFYSNCFLARNVFYIGPDDYFKPFNRGGVSWNQRGNFFRSMQLR